MSGNLNREFSSMDSPRTPARHGSPGTPRQLGNGHNVLASPLKLFGQAKKKINSIFMNIASYIDETGAFLGGIPSEEQIVSPEEMKKVKDFQDKVSSIGEVLSRDHMKVVFFGRTSNGKSTVINAMLRRKILPSGIGHTTNCFVQVEGSDADEGYLLIGDSEEKISIHSISDLASAISDDKMEPQTLIRVNWPKNKCSLLKEDIVMLDSPGVDVSPDLDSWIDQFCLDADVFVLVANAESTLMQTEKNFFLKVSDKLSKPNVFIINNRWDASASEPEMMDKVRKQHMERNVAFLVDELKVATKQEAEDRVFFVSAREVLISRAPMDAGSQTPTPTGTFPEGHQARMFEFANFERKFEECISKSAVKTKFEQHTKRGKLVSNEIKQVMDSIYDKSVKAKKVCIERKMETNSHLDFVESQLNLLTVEVKDKIKQMVEDVENKVSKALNEEIRRLSSLVDEFDRPFHPDPNLLAVYKKELHAHVEDGLGHNLRAKCSDVLLRAVETTETDMTDRVSQLLPDDKGNQLQKVLPRRDFEIAYRLDCRNLCADFQEDVEFRFSLGIQALVRRFLGPKQAGAVLRGRGYSGIPQPLTPQTPCNEALRPPVQEDNEVILTLLTTFTSLTSRSTIGAIVVAGLITKAAGLRVIAIAGAIYGSLYLYEWLMWTNKAKERQFKRQYVDYASSKLRLIVDLTSSNCSHQVQQELSSNFGRLCGQVDNAKHDLEQEIRQLNKESAKLEDIANKAKMLRNKAGYLDSELDTFVKQFLCDES